MTASKLTSTFSTDSRIITHVDQLNPVKHMLGKASLVICDIETHKTNTYWPKPILGMAIGIPVGVELHSFYVVDRVWQELTYLLDDKELVFHNAHFDLRVLRKEGGWDFKGIVWDTMLMAHLCDENQMSFQLDSLGLQHFGIRKNPISYGGKATTMKLWEKAFGWENIPPQIMGDYAMQDLHITHKLYVKYRAELERQKLLDVWQLSAQYLRVLMDVTDAGVLIDWHKLADLRTEAESVLPEIRSRLGFDPAKPSQLARALHGPPAGSAAQAGYVPRLYLTGKGAPSLDADSLERYSETFGDVNLPNGQNVGSLLDEVIRYRKVQKALSTWYVGFEEQNTYGRLHPGLKQAGTRTGRLSCAEPNLQQLPRDGARVKSMFIAPQGFKLVEFDYSQIELRLGSIYAKEKAGDPLMYETYKKGADVHHQTAELIGSYSMMESRSEARQAGKQGNFLWIYRGGAATLQKTLRRGYKINVTLDQCKVWTERFHENYPGFRKINNICERAAAKQGYIKYWNGRRRHFNRNKQDECRKAFNSVVQGGAAMIIMAAMIKIHRMNLPAKMIGQVHDSIWFYIPEDQIEEQSKLIVAAMRETPEARWDLPFEVDSKVWDYGL